MVLKELSFIQMDNTEVYVTPIWNHAKSKKKNEKETELQFVII